MKSVCHPLVITQFSSISQASKSRLEAELSAPLQSSSPSLRVFEDDALDLPFHVYRMRERAMGFEPRWIQNLMIAGGSEPAGSGKGDKRPRNPPQSWHLVSRRAANNGEPDA